MMMQVFVRSGVRPAPMCLRCGIHIQPFSLLSPRNLSQTAAALQEPVAGDASGIDKSLNRTERLALMENFVRKHWAEEGNLPSAYILMKEFGGARTTAARVLSRIEEEFKSKNIVPQSAPVSEDVKVSKKEDVTKSYTTAAEATGKSETDGETAKGRELKATKEANEVKAATEAKGTSEVKEPSVSLWQKLHSIAYGKSQPTNGSKTPQATNGKAPPQVTNGKPSPAGQPLQPGNVTMSQPGKVTPQTGKVTSQPSNMVNGKAGAMQTMQTVKSILSDTSEDDTSETDSESDVDTGSFDSGKNPAEPLFRSDLQPRHGLYIKFLSPQATESDVRGAFRSCGEIHRVQVVRSRNAAAKYIYAFVDFKTEESLKAALKKEVVIRGSKVQTEPANKNMTNKEKEKAVKHESSSEDETEVTAGKMNAVTVKNMDTKMTHRDTAPDNIDRRHTVAVENIPHGSLPQIVDALSHYGDILNTKTKCSPAGNTTAYIEFKNECDKDNALTASRVHLGGKSLKMTRIDSPPTTVVRLSNIPADALDKIAVSYKSYGQVDKVETRMDGIVDIYYSANEMNNMARILDKLNALQVTKKKLRAVPAPISYPKSLREMAETPVGLKWIESQRELVSKHLEISLKKAAMYSQDLQELLNYQQTTKSIAS